MSDLRDKRFGTSVAAKHVWKVLNIEHTSVIVRLLRIHTLREFSLLAFVAPCKPGRAQGRPKGQEGPRGQRDQRALWALWAKGPFGPLGEGAFGALGAHGAVGIIPKLFRMGLFYDFISRVGGKRGWTGWSPFSWPWAKLPNQKSMIWDKA